MKSKEKALYNKAKPVETERDWREPLNTGKHIKKGLQGVHDNVTIY